MIDMQMHCNHCNSCASNVYVYLVTFFFPQTLFYNTKFTGTENYLFRIQISTRFVQTQQYIHASTCIQSDR